MPGLVGVGLHQVLTPKTITVVGTGGGMGAPPSLVTQGDDWTPGVQVQTRIRVQFLPSRLIQYLNSPFPMSLSLQV